jgi:S1-C subfamily serine protease
MRRSYAGFARPELVEDPYSVLRDADPGDELRIEFIRDGRRLEHTVTLAGRPS